MRLRPVVLAAAVDAGGLRCRARAETAAYHERDGDAICADYRTAIARLGQPIKLAEIGTYLADALPVLERTAKRIERLDPPGELRDEYAAFRDAVRGTVDRAAQLREAATEADAEEVQRVLKASGEASKRREELARAAGLKECARL